ncbi:MAG: hypothetical protein Unbinned3972contig1001_29 [Prokaryotic dsDNA virus sp.]|nr:MAG: hypothetical protein Unbinned3972contig1001_29 [Prokaryotic dsDNA virus sp.]|tara:strand:- start:16982 stop:18580 length:1599 start_codon:yes stop_codon:yes gene_type:complete
MAEPYKTIGETRRERRAEEAKKRMPEYADDPYAVAFPDISGQEGSTWEEISDYRKALRQARMGAVAGFVPSRLQGAAQGAAGVFPTGVSWQEQGAARQALIDALAAYEQSENELESQGLRHNYQTRTAEANELATLGRLLQQGISSTASASARNAEIALNKALGFIQINDKRIANRGMHHGEIIKGIDDEMVNEIGRFVQPVANDPKGRREHEIDAAKAVPLLKAIEDALTGNPKVDAAFIERVEAQHQLNLGQYFGWQVDANNQLVRTEGAEGSLEEAAEGIRASMEGNFMAAQRARAAMRQEDAKYEEQMMKAFDGLTKAGAGLPGFLDPVFARFTELMGRKAIKPNSQTAKGPGGTLTVTGQPGQAVAPEGSTTEQVQTQTTQTDREPSRDMLKEQFQAQIDHIDNPNPPGKVLQAKNDIIDSALFQAFKQNNEFETDDVAYRAFVEESRDRDREAKAKDTEKLQQRRMEREGGKGNLRTRMAEGFAMLRPRYRNRRLAAETTAQTPTQNDSPTEDRAKNQKPEDEAGK